MRTLAKTPQFYMQMPKRIDKKVNRLEIKFEWLIEAFGQIDNVEANPKKLAEGQRKLGEYTV